MRLSQRSDEVVRTASLRWLAWTLVVTAAFAFGCAASRPPARTQGSTPTDPNALPAPAMYLTLCSHCHGPDAKGYAADQAPSLVNPTFLESASDAYLHQSIAHGRPGTSMAAYAMAAGGPLDSTAIDRLVGWIRSHGPPARELAPVATGDAARGQPLYASACQRCHGDARTRGDDVMLANPGFLAVASDAFIQHAILEGRPGTPMVSFREKLSATQIADIIAYLRSLAAPVDHTRLRAPTGQEPLFAFPHGRTPDFRIRADRFVGVGQVDTALLEHRKMVIVDARPESDWMKSHITGAVSIPYYQLARLEQIPKDAWVIAYCACPHHLSGVVVDSLRARGYPHAFVLDEGVQEWERRGYPMVAAPGASLVPSSGAATR